MLFYFQFTTSLSGSSTIQGFWVCIINVKLPVVRLGDVGFVNFAVSVVHIP